ncbi:glycosyltransferase family 4 protein [Desulfuribacillus alkaliarsenatis]|uniref:Glycosyltransferase WbuB n=1 Tax=Desulfuribacillus alkaliarsenatis TaxID=766136 RepID=A0A1E5G1R2_9FIRM|nr:glycosyltransferase family 4 protein [Desulfuribacillus alkaliarsenatis]OEF96835.1 hypothetical protein BHF68_07180 [Desulfuribacillus alkaliarsenatis]
MNKVICKNIYILNHYAVTPDTGGGTRHFDIAKQLVALGHDVTIIASSFEHKTRQEKLERGEQMRVEVIEGVRFVWLRTFPYEKNDWRRVLNMLTFAWKLLFIQKNEDKPDLIIASSFHPLTCVSGYFLSKKMSSRYWVEIRDLWPQTAIDMGRIKEKSIIARVLKSIESFIYNKAERVIVLLPKAVDYVKAIAGDKVYYLPNGVDVERHDKRIQITEPLSVVDDIIERHKDKCTMVYLGAFGPANALDIIIDAVKILQEKNDQVPDVIFVGDGPEKERLQQRITEEGLTTVFIYPPIKKYNVPQLLKHIDVGLITMRDLALYKYGFSFNKLFDYMCASLPIIFSGRVSNNIVQNADAGICIEPENAEQLAEAMTSMMNLSVAERRRLGANGRSYVEVHHDTRKLAEQLHIWIEKSN